MNKRFLLLGMICVILFLSACASTVQVQTAAPTVEKTLLPAITLEPTLEPTEEKTPIIGTVTVRGGDTLERDIIPQLCDVFSLSEEQVKSRLAAVQSSLIDDELTDFRRMEGIIVPNSYDVTNETLDDYIGIWITEAETRYDSLLAECADNNGLEEWEQLTLASIVDWECIGDEYQTETASVFINRLNDNAKLQSCVTVEYVLGYERPYLTYDDIEVDSVYNTYQNRGLPPGPICTMDDESLLAAMQKSVDDSLYFFFYDYASDTMYFFSDYSAFKEKANISKEAFSEAFDFGKYDIIDKRSVFG